MSGGICVCVCEGNHPSSHQYALTASFFAISGDERSHVAALWGPLVTAPPAVRGFQGGRVFDSVPGGLPERQHQSREHFLHSSSSFPLSKTG